MYIEHVHLLTLFGAWAVFVCNQPPELNIVEDCGWQIRLFGQSVPVHVLPVPFKQTSYLEM